MKKWISVVALCTTLIVASLSTAFAQTSVGLLLPQSGVFAALGKEIDDGFVFALEEAGRLDEFSIVREDTEVKPAVGLAKARKLVLQDKVDTIVGVVSSGVLAAMRDFIDRTKVPLIVANAGNDHATGKNCSANIVRVSFSNGQINRPMGQWLYDRGIKTIYTLAPDYAAGHQMIDAFTKSFVAAGGKIVGGEFTPFRKTKDFGPYLANAKAANPDGVYVFYAGGEAISFVKQYDSFDIKSDIPLFGSGFLTSPLYVNAEGPAAEGIVTALHYVPTLDTPENKAFVKAFKAKFNRLPSEFAVQGYDAARLLLRAVEAGANDRQSIVATLPTVKYTGPRGPLEIDPATNNVVQNVYFYETVMENGILTQKILGQANSVQDAPNGCVL